MQALILAGGSGTRFWPLSRRSRPKQFLTLEGERSLLQATVDRLQPIIPAKDVWICTTAEHVEAVAEQLPEVAQERILAEPCGRNTAPAIAWALGAMPSAIRQGVVAVLPADHRVGRPDAFRAALALAGASAERDNKILTLGVLPDRAETGYGYLEVAERDDKTQIHRVARFTEKPDLATARGFVDSGRYLWNAGIFVFRGATLEAHLRTLAPEISRGLDSAAADPPSLERVYSKLPSISIDFAVMEKLEELWTVTLDCEWSDLGSWSALAEIVAGTEGSSGGWGDVVELDGGNNLLIADQGAIAVLGVRDLVVVRTGDSVLVIPKNRAQEVRRIVEQLQAEGRDQLL